MRRKVYNSRRKEGIMDSVTIIGLIAGALTTTSFLPQVYTVWKSKSSKDISLGMYIIFCTGVFLWLIYGLSLQSLPIIAANTVTFVLSFTILAFKIKHLREERRKK